jgi:SulP family sulfate permease
VRDVLERGGFIDAIGRDRVFDTKADALRAIYAALDVATCRDCAVRVFTECRDALPDGTPRDPPRPTFALAASR